MSKVWDEAAIREEIVKLDKKTGLNGAVLPIGFDSSKRTLGSFHFGNDDIYFTFSEVYYKNPD